MPFIGLDWRAPGETWVRTPKGWERMKLRPLQRYGSDVSLERPTRAVESRFQSIPCIEAVIDTTLSNGSHIGVVL
ncbi:hypothetical protein D918_03926 [Trichuris suis]|nr:hypothetical protein D918_03926 [Trichuris suis]